MFAWFRNWRNRAADEADLAEEMRAHLAIETRQRMERGLSPGEAEREARRAFGSLSAIREETRETWGWAGFQRLLDDCRFGLRLLRKTPAWTVTVVATIALGIGMSTSIFSALYGVLLKPLAYPEPGRLVALWPSAPYAGYARFSVSAALWEYWRASSQSFQDIALTRPIANFNLTGSGMPERIKGARCTANLATVLGVQPLHGRMFTEQERLADSKVAVLSHGLWLRRFAADPGIIGRSIQLNGEAYHVLAVMPADFRYPSSEFELWTPLFYPPAEVQDGGNYQYLAVGRLKPAVSLDQARAEMDTLMARRAADLPFAYRTPKGDVRVLLETLALSDAAQVRATLYALMGAAGCLLLIGSLNLGLLLVARLSARAQELAVRQALGASAPRLRRQILAEVLPLAVFGAAGGVLLAWWLLRIFVAALPANTPRLDGIGLQLPVVAFAVAASSAVVLLAAILPARISARTGLTAALRETSRAIASGGRGRGGLIVAQIAITLALVCNAALFARSLQRIWQVNPGFSTDGILTMHLSVTRAKYTSDRQVAAYLDRLLARVRSIPGVTAAGLVNRLPLSGIAQTGGVEFEGIASRYDVDWRSITPGYLETMGIPLERGRAFSDRDTPDAPLSGIIDAELARRAFGTQDPIGRRFRAYAGARLTMPWTTIVGVAGHIRNDGPETDMRPQVYWPETQRTQDRGALVVRTTGPPESFTAAIREQIRQEDPDQPVYEVRTMREWLAQTAQNRNLLTGLVVLFAGASLLLAALGIYGVVSYSASLRLREFGIRVALGATPGDVRRLVLGRAARLVAAGVGAGFVLAVASSRAIESMLFGITPFDPVSWLAGTLLLALCGLAAALLPARRAATADPSVTLRADLV